MKARLLGSEQCIFCAFRLRPWQSLSTSLTPLRSPFSSVTKLHRAALKPRAYPQNAVDRETVNLWNERPYARYEPNHENSSFFRKVDHKHPTHYSEHPGTKSARAKLRRTPETDRDIYYALKPKLDELRQLLTHPETLENLGLEEPALEELLQLYEDQLCKKSKEGKAPALQALGRVLSAYGEDRLDQQLKYDFMAFLGGYNAGHVGQDNRNALADLRYPAEWFSATRVRNREIHLHIGPTNSGKTYHALKKLEEANSGIYAGPLRLLAHEVFTRMNAKGKRCALKTGEEHRYPDDNFANPCTIISATVEMINLAKTFDVAVIDEIQMIGDHFRGWAWTTAFMGVMASEVHLCGETRTEPLIRELCSAMGEKLHIHRYERLSPLKMEEKSLDGKLKNLRKGDCIICFSVMGIHAMKREIENYTGKNVAVVYGSLPPETRAQQARLFNDPNNDYDILVASDAVGMGLNLSIKRIIFESSAKSNGHLVLPLKISEVKQIAGRAGRYRTADQSVQSEQTIMKTDRTANDGTPSHGMHVEKSLRSSGSMRQALTEPAADTSALDITTMDSKQRVESHVESSEKQTTGYVTTFEKWDYPLIRNAMEAEAGPILTAGLQPPVNIIERYCNYFPPDTPLSYILLRLCDVSQLHPRFHMCIMKDQLAIADAIENISGLSILERLIFINGPSAVKTEDQKGFVQGLAEAVVEQKGGSLLDLPCLELELLDTEPTGTRQHLKKLESLHKKIIAYLWLSYRFTGIFTTRALANHVKALVEDRIDLSLKRRTFIKSRLIRAAREQKIKEMLDREKEESLAATATTEVASEEGEDGIERDVEEAERGEPYLEPDLFTEPETQNFAESLEVRSENQEQRSSSSHLLHAHFGDLRKEQFNRAPNTGD